MNSYKILNKQVFTEGVYSLVPIRCGDRYDIMKWRNEQIYHLRQVKPLIQEDQDYYFKTIVSKLFEQERPGQLLFSYLEDGKCIGYGGLVHINWIDKNAEISFIMDTNLEKDFFEFHWTTYLDLIKTVAFKDLGLHKIYTYAFDLRPRLYDALSQADFVHEATLSQHCSFEGEYKNVLIHSQINKLKLRKATLEDLEKTFHWASDAEIRRFSFNKNPITKEEHHSWFEKKMKDENCLYLILEDTLCDALGSIRIDMEGQKGTISYLLDSFYHGRGLGKTILKLLERFVEENNVAIGVLIGFVMKGNIASIKIFESLGYTKSEENDNLKFVKKLK